MIIILIMIFNLIAAGIICTTKPFVTVNMCISVYFYPLKLMCAEFDVGGREPQIVFHMTPECIGDTLVLPLKVNYCIMANAGIRCD